MEDSPSSINESDITQALDELVSQNLIIRSKDRYLALATSVSDKPE
jgi:DNA-binding MarR family transcriptional regulator